MTREPATWREATADERLLAEALASCTFSVASFDKRFARDVRACVLGGKITEKQAALLRLKVGAYRRQIPPSSLPEHLRPLLVKPPSRKPPEAP